MLLEPDAIANQHELHRDAIDDARQAGDQASPHRATQPGRTALAGSLEDDVRDEHQCKHDWNKQRRDPWRKRPPTCLLGNYVGSRVIHRRKSLFLAHSLASRKPTGAHACSDQEAHVKPDDRMEGYRPIESESTQNVGTEHRLLTSGSVGVGRLQNRRPSARLTVAMSPCN
jgi:hypothetical protein